MTPYEASVVVIAFLGGFFFIKFIIRKSESKRDSISENVTAAIKADEKIHVPDSPYETDETGFTKAKETTKQ